MEFNEETNMTKEEKDLLLRDLCMRLPYSTLCYCKWTKDAPNDTSGCVQEVSTYLLEELMIIGDPNYECQICEIKPYLRPLSSITEAEKIELYKIAGFYYFSNDELLKNEWRQFSGAFSENKLFLPYPIWGDDLDNVYDWLNAHHFDYRGLIPMGLALEASEGIYNN